MRVRRSHCGSATYNKISFCSSFSYQVSRARSVVCAYQLSIPSLSSRFDSATFSHLNLLFWPSFQMDNDPTLKMYEAQAIAIEKQQEINKLKKEKEELEERLRRWELREAGRCFLSGRIHNFRVILPAPLSNLTMVRSLHISSQSDIF